MFYSSILFLFRLYFRLFYRHRVFGLENLPKGAAILAPNHTSFWDPPLVGVSCPEKIHFLARAQLFEIPGLGQAICRLNAHPVEGSAKDLKSLKIICQLLKQSQKIVIFPEGIRSWDGKLLPVKTGVGLIAQRTNAPIIPIYLEGVFDIWPRTRRFPRLLGKTSCHFGKPIYPAEFDHLGKKEAQSAMARQVEESLKALEINVKKSRN